MVRLAAHEKGRRRSARFWGLGVLGFGAAIALILTGTTPDRLGPLGITAWFLLLMAALVCLGMWLRALILRQPKSTSLLVVILFATLPVGALALNTIELQTAEIFLLLIFGVTLVIYWTKLR
jgi:hypothetical protein